MFAASPLAVVQLSTADKRLNRRGAKPRLLCIHAVLAPETTGIPLDLPVIVSREAQCRFHGGR